MKDMLTHNDWIMHAKATRSLGLRALNQGDAQAAATFFSAARRMEQMAEQEGVLPMEHPRAPITLRR
ncbi:hypothetical protein SAE02_41370 [Skermanella aerolata]|uniref:Uncharacterized protein n=2 Tax=Skermanella aerolata TaxID=393310 RepID=A0A512DU37_9PROT|nr:hypothetical protein SAE02_41370 [Skermanella aerolata]